MALTLADLRAHSPDLPDEDAYLTRTLEAAKTHIANELGYALDDAIEFPGGTPADVEQAVLMLAAHWIENREASIVGMAANEVPMGVADIVRNNRRWTFG